MIKSQKNQLKKVTSSNFRDPPQFENKLRPRNFVEYIGQKSVKDNISIAIIAAKLRKQPLDHILFHGPAGLGKTTLALILAKEMDSEIKITSGPALERPGDVASIISNLKENDILFIDEIHRLKPVVEEILYSAMEDFGIDIIIGKGPSARNMRISLPRFTLIGATTKINMLSSPLLSRFGNIFKLQFYTIEDIQNIILRSASILNCDISNNSAQLLAQSARQTPRIANRLLKQVSDFALVHESSSINEDIIDKALKALGVDKIGLDDTDREILSIIIEKFKGGPVGLNTLSAAISEEEATIEDIYEPFLIQLGFLERTARGRLVTEKAYKHLGLNISSI